MNARIVHAAHAAITRATLFTLAGRQRGIDILAFDFLAGGYTKRKHRRISWFPDGDR